jgi:hypothetical protein
MGRKLGSQDPGIVASRIVASRVEKRAHSGVDVKACELVQSQDVNVVELNRHVVAEFMSESEVPLLRVRRFEVLIKHPATCARKWVN